MKNLMSILIATLAYLSTTLYADTRLTFTTKKQALHFCPASNQLTFKTDGSFILSNGTISAYHNGKVFSSGTKNVLHPKYLNQNHVITDAHLRKDQGIYGYKDNNTITCNYNYITVFLYNYPLKLTTV